MMYLSKTTLPKSHCFSEYTIGVILPNNFGEYLLNLDLKFREIEKLDSANISYDLSQVRLLENPVSECYVDKTEYSIPPGEDYLEYYGYEIRRELYPTEEFWEFFKPDHCNLFWHQGGNFGFEAIKNHEIYTGFSFSLNQWLTH